MDMDTAMNADNEEQLQVEDAGDSSGFAFTEILPLNRDTDVSYVTECVCGEWSAQNEQENLVFLKEEPNQVPVCYVYEPCSVDHNVTQNSFIGVHISVMAK